MKSYSSKDILNILQQNGWYIDSQRGSHIHLKHAQFNNKVTVPHPRKDLPVKTVKSIFLQAKLDFTE